MLKKRIGLVVWIVLVMMFSLASAISVNQMTVTSAGTISVDGSAMPVYRVMLSLGQLRTGNIKITMPAATREYFRFVNYSDVGMSSENDQKLLDEDGKSHSLSSGNVVNNASSSYIQFFATGRMPETGFFTCYVAPKSREAYEMLMSPENQISGTDGSVQIQIGVDGAEASASLRLSAPGLSIELMNESEGELTDGSLSLLSYRLSVNDPQEQINNGQTVQVICRLVNQVLDYDSLILPADTVWFMQGDDLCFSVPDQTKAEIRFGTVPYFEGADPELASTGVVSITAAALGFSDAVRRTIKYTQKAVGASEYIEILAVRAGDHRVPVRGVQFELRSSGDGFEAPGSSMLITTDENGKARLIGEKDQYGTSSWHLEKDAGYELVEKEVPDGYFPLGEPVPFMMTDTYVPSEGKYRSGDVLLIAYQEGVSSGISGTYSLTGRDMRPDEVRQFILAPANDAAKDYSLAQIPADCTADVSGDQAAGNFAFGEMRFFAPGEYDFEIQQEDLSAVGIRHGAEKIIATISVVRNADTGILSISGMKVRQHSGDTQSETDRLIVSDSYEASGEHTIQGCVTVDGTQPGMEMFRIELMQNGGVIDTTECASDGTFSFGPVIFTSEMADEPVFYSVVPVQPTDNQTRTGLYLITEPCSISLTAADDGNGGMTVTESGDTPIRIEYAHKRTLTVNYRVHNCPPSKSDAVQKLSVTVDAVMNNPIRIRYAESESEVPGEVSGTSTIYSCDVKNGAELTLQDIPVQTDFRMSFSDDADATAGFTYMGQTYQSTEMNGRIGACIPEYEALMIYPYGEWTPEVKLRSLAEMDMSGLKFTLQPADEASRVALDEGWVCFSDGTRILSGVPDSVFRTDAGIRYQDADGRAVQISLYKPGRYVFEAAVSDADRETVGFKNEKVLIELTAEKRQADGLDISQQDSEPEIVCYPLEKLDISVSESTLADEHSLKIKLEHPDVNLADCDVQIIRNGVQAICHTDGNIGTLREKAGDTVTLLLPLGTVFRVDTVEDELSTELVPAGDTAVIESSLESRHSIRYEVRRKTAGISIKVCQNMDEPVSGRLCFQMFETAELSSSVSEVPLTVLVNGRPVEIAGNCLTVKDGDTISLSGPLSGLWCEMEVLEPSGAICRISVNDGPYQDLKTASVLASSERAQSIDLVQNVMAVNVTGTVKVLGEALNADCFEVCVEDVSDGLGTETIACPASEDGQYVFSGSKHVLTETKTYSYRLTEKPVKSMPMMITDSTVYTVDYKVMSQDDGTVSVQKILYEIDASGHKHPADAISFKNIKLFPLQIQSETVGKDKPMSYQLNVKNAGNQTRFAYTIGTKNGQMDSGDVLTLLNEQATVWLPYGAEYEIRVVPAAGYEVLPEEGEQLSGTVGQSVLVHLTGQYKPAVVLNDAGDAEVPVSVVFENAQWTDEVFILSLQPAYEDTQNSAGKGFRFVGGDETLEYQVSGDKSSFKISLIESGQLSGKGIEVLNPGKYVFCLKQIGSDLSEIQVDEHEEMLVLNVADDDNGHLFPSLRLAEQNTESINGIVFRNKALASLTVSCSVEPTNESQSSGKAYEKRGMQFLLSAPGIQNEAVTVTFSRAGGTETQTLQAVDGGINVALAHGESVAVSGLPAGILYTVQAEQTDGYLAERQTEEGVLAYRSTAEADFRFVYSPSVQFTVTGQFQMLYREELQDEAVVFALTPMDDFTRETFGDAFRLETTVSVNGSQVRKLRAGSVPLGQQIVFEPLLFEQTGTYMFELSQVSELLPHTIYDDSRYQVKITVSDPEPGSGKLHAESEILLDGQPTTASFVNLYEASGQIEITGYLKPFERQVRAGEFMYELLDEDGTVISQVRIKEDGTFSFDPLSYAAQDIGQVRYYLVRQKRGSVPGVEYDSQEFRVITAVRDDGDGALTVAAAYSKKDAGGAWNNTGRILFENHYSASGSFMLSGRIHILGRSFLLGEVFTLHLLQENDACEWLEVETASLEPKGKRQGTVDFNELEYTLSDVEDSPIYYKLNIEGPFSSLLQIDGENEIPFSVDLEDIGDGRLSVNSSLDEAEFLIRAFTEQTIECEFDDLDNQNDLRPKSLSVSVRANGKEMKQLMLNADNDWKTTTGLLPMADEDGNNIRYTLEPVSAKPYGLTLNGDDVRGYKLVARYRPHYETSSEILTRVLEAAPDTGDSQRIGIYIAVFAVTAAILILFVTHSKKK